MIDLRHPLSVLATRLPWGAFEAALVPRLVRKSLPSKLVQGQDLLGTFEDELGGVVSPAGRLRLPVRLMTSLLYLKYSFNLSDSIGVENRVRTNGEHC